MLLKVSRSALKQGTADTVEGTAATSVVYGVPLTGDRAPYAMGASATAGWVSSTRPRTRPRSSPPTRCRPPTTARP
ncbi:hypothetical protein SGLAM104S_08007 [Streptomyces glaucescens]